MLQKQVVFAGVVCVLMSLISILRRLSDLASLGPNMAVAILTMLYAMIFEMLLLPLQLEAKRRIIGYMEVDTDMESGAAFAGSESEKDIAQKEQAGDTEERQI